jgi:hypothetical protein
MRILFLFLLITEASLCFPIEFPVDDNDVVLKYSVKNDLIVIPVEINGCIFRMILDSGSPVNLVFNNKKKLSSLSPKRLSIRSVGDQSSVYGEISLHNTINVKHLSITDVAFLVDESSITAQFEVDGIIGYPLFQHFEIEINPTRQEILLRKADMIHEHLGFDVIPLAIKGAKAFAASLSEQFHNNFDNQDVLVDTGSSLGIFLKTNSRVVTGKKISSRWTHGDDQSIRRRRINP